MMLSTSSEATSIDAPPIISMSTDSILDASILRVFAVILCTKCQYLEFPGCDVHGALYTDRLTDADGIMQHAKCPSCTASTNNARPFRDGCRRCKSPTNVVMWVCSLQEVQLAIEAFPDSTEEIEHTVIYCELCLSSIFPRAREKLTTRLDFEQLAAVNGKPLKVSNFQLSMPHVDGCLRKGMPLQAVAVRLPKSELRFVMERIYKCPRAPRLTGKPQYRPRQLKLVTQQNHLHQVAFRLLISVIGNFDASSPAANQPIRQVLTVLEKMEPLGLFMEWSPHRQLSQTKVFPNEVIASSCYDEQHVASRILENGPSFWRSGSKSDNSTSQQDEWIVCQFSSAVTLSSIEIEWQANFAPKRFSVSISRHGMPYETVAIVMEPSTVTRLLVPKGGVVTSIKIIMFSSEVAGETFCLKSIVCKQASFHFIHTSTVVVLQNIQHWLFDAAVSPYPDVRNLALVALQKLLLASGSLCGLLKLVMCLLLNTHNACTTLTADVDEQVWDRLDQLSGDEKESAGLFLKHLATSVRHAVIVNGSRNGAEDNDFKDILRRKLSAAENCFFDEDTNNFGLSATSITLLVGRPKFLEAIKRRSQLGMIILLMLSEVSTWQMKQMQRAEEFTGKEELKLMQLEEPFSIEICSDFFAISHRLIVNILSRWLTRMEKHLSNSDLDEGENKGSDTNYFGRLDLYNALESSFNQFLTDAGPLEYLSGIDVSLKEKLASHPKFSPDGLCVAMLDVITSNLRRLVLSKVDPLEIGIQPALVNSKDDVLSVPLDFYPIVLSLEQLIALGAKRSDTFFNVSLKAAAAMEAGTEVFYPSADQRTKVLTSRMGMGATLEVQVRWPVQERDQEDPRYERLILMLQIECIKLSMRNSIRGNWCFFMHLLVEIPSTRSTEEFLTQHFAPCIQRAGFLSWQVAAGAQELSINLQRHLHWNRVEKMSQDSGDGWIRVYPADVATYDEVVTDVEEFLAKHIMNKAEMARP
ncbi:putative Galactose-binding-like domain superfamily [Plasmopara halstedii]